MKNVNVCNISYLNTSAVERWNSYVENHGEASFFHRAEWKEVLEKSFGHRTFYLMAETDGVISGLLPLAQVKSILFGNALVSTPFCVYGGPVSDSKEIEEALIERAKELAEALAVDYLELRTIKPLDNGFITKELYVTFRMSLAEDRDSIMSSIWRKQRTVIRKSFKQGLSHTFDESITDLYNVYAQSVRNLGTPVFSRKYFQTLKDVFGEKCEVLTVRNNDGVAVSSVLSFYDKGEVFPYYGGGTLEARGLKSNDYMYYELMCHAAMEKDCKKFDFGRSKINTGSYVYKKHWKIEPECLNYQYYLVKAKEMPNLSPSNPKYNLLISVWQKLPLKVSQFLGPFLSKYLG